MTDEQIKEGLAELRESGHLATKSPEEIFEHIRQKNLLPRSKRFELRAAEVSKKVRLVSLVQARTLAAIGENDSLKQSVTEILAASDIADDRIDLLADRLINAVTQRRHSTHDGGNDGHRSPRTQ